MTMLHASISAVFLLSLALTADCGIFGDIESGVKGILGIGQAPAPSGSFLSAEAPVPLFAPSPSGDDTYADLKALLTNSSGPIVYKAADAALHLYNESLTDRQVSSKSQIVQLSNSSGVLLASYINSSITLAFNSTNDLYGQLLKAGNATTQEPSFLATILNGTGALPSVLQPIQDLISGNGSAALKSVIANVTGGRNPSRIVTTGFGAGGGLAQLAALWAAVTWTQSQIRCITFGAPPVLNSRAGFAFQQFVDLSNVWAYNGSALVNTILRTTDNNTDPTVDGTYTFANYVQAIKNAGAYAAGNNDAPNPGISYEVANSTAPVPSSKGLFGAVPGTLNELSGTAAPTPSYEFPNQTEIQTLLNPAPAPQQPNSDCPLILCKVRAPAEASCGDYEVYVKNSSFVPILQALPGSQQIVTQPYDTHVVVDWDSTSRVVLLIWRGSITEQDWLQDAKLKLVNGSYLLSPALNAVFPMVETHYGFSEQFREVTDQANSSANNIADILAKKLNGVTPQKVVCAGHSLGAALASLCAVWASVQYPSADVLAVTIGQPYTGNQGYVDTFRTLVGREYRIIHQLDLVPAIPPVSSYRHVGLGIWEFDGQVQMRDRPAYRLDDLNWEDHSCYNYSSTLNNAPNITILSNATAQVAQSLSAASS